MIGELFVLFKLFELDAGHSVSWWWILLFMWTDYSNWSSFKKFIGSKA